MLNLDISHVLSTLAVAAVPALLGIILHEVAHGWVAYRCGDPTAKFMGRLTVNPLPHIDPMGLLAFVLTSLSGAFVFGWAKPVPVNPRYFRNPAKEMMLVALAGPLTNFLLATLFGLLLWAVIHIFPPQQWLHSSSYVFALKTIQTGVIINFGLGWMNLIPIPPLDGSKVLFSLLPDRAYNMMLRYERYGMFLLWAVVLLGVGDKWMSAAIQWTYELFCRVVGF